MNVSIVITQDAAKRDKTTAVQLHDLHPDDVINEVFSSQLKEVRDEVIFLCFLQDTTANLFFSFQNCQRR